MENLKYTEILQLNKSLSATVKGSPYRIGLLSNVTINSFKDLLEYTCRKNQIAPEVEIGNFDNIVQDSMAFREKNLVIVFFDTLNLMDQMDGFFEDTDEDTYQQFQQKLFAELGLIFHNLKDTASVIFNTFSGVYYLNNLLAETKTKRFIGEANRFLRENAPKNFILNDIDLIYSKLGIQNSFDRRFYESSKAPYTVQFLKHYALAIEPVLLKNNGKQKKALIFDCDNTLWHGIIGEDGMEGIEMNASGKKGRYFRRVQQLALFLSKRGVIIGLCSKNNEADVLEVLRTHKDMVLREENIVIHKINWTDKASNLAAIAEDLNIGTDSLVFVDDSSFEINLIRERLPEVQCIHVPTNFAEYPEAVLKEVYRLFNLNPNKDDLKKTEMYKQQALRESSKQQFGSIDDYLASLGIELGILVNDPNYIPRIAQLTQKTNQFNLTTIRYTENQISQFMGEKGSYVAAMFVKDKFGDSGLTGVCILREDKSDPKTMHIDSLLMSCRILGRNIEYVFTEHLLLQMQKKGYTRFTAAFLPTKKNAQVQDYFEKIGFDPVVGQDGSKTYRLDISTFKPRNLNYIKINLALNV